MDDRKQIKFTPSETPKFGVTPDLSPLLDQKFYQIAEWQCHPDETPVIIPKWIVTLKDFEYTVELPLNFFEVLKSGRFTVQSLLVGALLVEKRKFEKD